MFAYFDRDVAQLVLGLQESLRSDVAERIIDNAELGLVKASNRSHPIWRSRAVDLVSLRGKNRAWSFALWVFAAYSIRVAGALGEKC